MNNSLNLLKKFFGYANFRSRPTRNNKQYIK